MIEFLVGLLALMLLGIFSVLGILRFPLFILMGLFLRLIVGLLALIFVIWLIGKVTLVSIEYLRKRKDDPAKQA